MGGQIDGDSEGDECKYLCTKVTACVRALSGFIYIKMRYVAFLSM